jgi:hypothetical protein
VLLHKKAALVMVGLLVEQGSLIPEVVAVAVVDKVLHQEAVVVQVVLA